MRTSEVLDKAADIIEERGWAHGGTSSNDPWGIRGGKVCIEGGIAAAAGIDLNEDVAGFETLHYDCPAYNAVRSYLRQQGVSHIYVDRLYRWNDRADRTKEEVLVTL